MACDDVPVKKISVREQELLNRHTPWRSIYVVAILLMLLGLQMSIYFTSTWQYLSENDPTATVDFFGAILAISALVCAFANPILGHWNQVSGSTRKPVFCAFGVAALGNLIYAFSYTLPPYVKWLMLLGRMLTGLGPGSLGVLRSFVGTASTKADRMKAVTITNTGFTAGFFLGPTIQIAFIPLGKRGITLMGGAIHLNMYTTCAMFMTCVSALSLLLAYFLLEENYVGIIGESGDDPFFVLPTFDRPPVTLLFYMWWLMCGVVCVESMAAPLTMAMFNWNREEAVLYNGVIQTVSCFVTFLVNFTLASTRLKKCDNRILLLLGLVFFAIFFALHMPWPFYPAPLDRPSNTTLGWCDFDWCDYTPRVPMPLYLFIASVVIGLGFPLISSASNSLLSQILGPRKQGTVQGFFAFTGSFSQFVVSLFSTRVFNLSGYKWIMIYHFLVITVAIIGVGMLWRRLVPLKITPNHGTPTKYKAGIFYRM